MIADAVDSGPEPKEEIITGQQSAFTSNDSTAGPGKFRSADAVLQTVNLSKVYRSSAGQVIALNNVNLAIRKGELVSIVGPSGSGKSTLLSIIGGLDRPTGGRVIIRGQDLFSLNDNELATVRNKLIGFVFQSYNLVNRSTVLRNVELPAMISEMDSDERRIRAMKLLGILGIAKRAQYRPTTLSGGEQQRVAIARALMNNPAIILADEPTGNLDTKTGNEIFNLLKMLSGRYNRTIVVVTHNAELASATARIVYLRDGEIEREVLTSKRQLDKGSAAA